MTGSDDTTDNGARALVLFSGGQDSTTCLAWALDAFDHVETIGFDYAQRHAVELTCRGAVREQIAERFPAWGRRLAEDHLLDLPVLGAISETALTRETEIVIGEHGLPTSFVPGRNIVFLALAGALAYRRGLRHLVGGMCETDYSGYPDCRNDTLEAVLSALNLGMESELVLHTPLMWLDKAQIWEMAEALGGNALIELIVEQTHTCYTGDRTHRHDWGLGCGDCPACELRARGWQTFRGAGDRTATK